jgi:Flp pilus assembly protein TadG
VEFALASVVFLLMLFGTIDFGRAIFVLSDLHNSTREATRFGIIQPTNTTGIRNKVLLKRGLSTATVTVSCTGGCVSGGTVNVTATIPFSAVTQSFLGIPTITLRSSTSATIE